MERRDFFKGLFGLAAVPVLEPIAKLLPKPKPESYTTYLAGEDALTTYYNKDFLKAISYNIRFTTSLPPNTKMRIRNIRVPETISFTTYNLEKKDDPATKM